jgi:hypothetical protein
LWGEVFGCEDRRINFASAKDLDGREQGLLVKASRARKIAIASRTEIGDSFPGADWGSDLKSVFLAFNAFSRELGDRLTTVM